MHTIKACKLSLAKGACSAAVLAAAAAPAQASWWEPQPAASAWTQAVESAFDRSQVTEKGQGVTEFTACFKQVGRTCSRPARGIHFRSMQLRIFRPSTYHPTDRMAHVESYVSLSDSGQPAVFLRPYFLRKTGWLQMRKMTVTVDEKPLLVRAFESSMGLSGDGKQSVEEQAEFPLTSEQIDRLRQITPQSNVTVRLSGAKGEVNLSPWDLENFKADIANLLFSYDSLKLATSR